MPIWKQQNDSALRRKIRSRIITEGEADEPLMVRDFRIRNSNKSYRPINFWRKRLFHIMDRVSFWLQRADQAAIFKSISVSQQASARTGS